MSVLKRKAAEIRTLTEDEVKESIAELKKEQFNLRFQQATGQLENTARVKLVRRGIARYETVLREKRKANKYGSFLPEPVPPKKRNEPSRREEDNDEEKPREQNRVR